MSVAVGDVQNTDAFCVPTSTSITISDGQSWIVGGIVSTENNNYGFITNNQCNQLKTIIMILLQITNICSHKLNG